jgi:hypothetical protein
MRRDHLNPRFEHVKRVGDETCQHPTCRTCRERFWQSEFERLKGLAEGQILSWLIVECDDFFFEKLETCPVETGEGYIAEKSRTQSSP